MPHRTAASHRPLAASAVAAALLLFAAGCASYQLGSPAELQFSSVFVPPVVNDTFVPQSRAAITTAIREAFARDGRVVLAESAADADRVVEVRLSDFSREMTSALRDDTALARKFALTLYADVRLVDPATPDAPTATSRVSVSVDAYTDSGLQQAEFQAVPQLAEKLAVEVVHRVLDTW
ncbi:MAG TPA: LPS assembly lipoprotein LptE [Opitutaceae bacterium]|nr:LPS assembly lipoprotein LptE [Opitutaceae bacterium]